MVNTQLCLCLINKVDCDVYKFYIYVLETGHFFVLIIPLSGFGNKVMLVSKKKKKKEREVFSLPNFQNSLYKISVIYKMFTKIQM